MASSTSATATLNRVAGLFSNSSLNNSQYPFYYVDRPNLLDFMSDRTLVVVVPFVVFWVVCISFDILDNFAPSFLEKYRIHPSPEELSRNRVSKTQVIIAVLVQQAIQTVLGLWWTLGQKDLVLDPTKEIAALESWVSSAVVQILGVKTGLRVLTATGPGFMPWLYWWGIPILQYTYAFFIIDTWQYCLHRLMHTIPFLYRHLHSWHHRLHVPYAYASLYNHPVEGLALDIIGSLISYEWSGMTPRQGMLLFGFATAKTAHDHCGWSLPWDPMQFLFSNNAAYHDIHHQTIGIKSNFSQPFYVHWDTILGTKMTREEMEARRAKNRAKGGIKSE